MIEEILNDGEIQAEKDYRVAERIGDSTDPVQINRAFRESREWEQRYREEVINK